ncbi:MAG: domain S-box protein [Mucilaginibacter sp.]|nr:domain S-box protein [Mucilaginibacter sp.]
MQTEEIFEQSLLFNKLMLESMGDGLFCIDKSLCCTFINTSALQILGYACEDCIGINIHNLIRGNLENAKIYPDDQCSICRTLNDITGSIVEEEVFWKSDGNPITVRYRSNPIISNCEIIGVVVVFNAISKQKRKQDDIIVKTIQESLINATDDLIWAIDKDYRLITYNRSYSKKILNLTGKHARKGDPLTLEHFEDEVLKRWESYYRKAFNGEAFMVNEYTYNPVERKIEYGLISLAPMYDANNELFGVACLSKDVTKETSNHISLIESYNELENIFNQSMDIICVIDQQGKFRKISKACEKIWGYKIDDLVDKSYFDLVHADDLNQAKKMLEDLIEGADTNNFENHIVCKNGCLVPIIWSARWDEKVKLIFCVARDVTDKKLAEEKLIESEAFLEEAQRFAKMGSWSFDFKTDKITWSRELYNIFDVDIKIPAKTHGSFINLIDEQDRQIVERASKRTQETGEPFNIQYQITTLGGEKRAIEEFGYGEKDSNGQVVRLFGTAQDITERKRAEDKIREIAWIQSHIVRAPVTRIVGLISLIRDKLIDESEVEKILEYIILSTNELDDIIRDISDKTRIAD